MNFTAGAPPRRPGHGLGQGYSWSPPTRGGGPGNSFPGGRTVRRHTGPVHRRQFHVRRGQELPCADNDVPMSPLRGAMMRSFRLTWSTARTAAAATLLLLGAGLTALPSAGAADSAFY